MVAELLDIPHLGLAVAVAVADGRVQIDRPIEGAKVTVEAPLPALVTLGGAHAVWNPRYASLPGIMKAKKKPLAVKTLADLGLAPDQVGSRGRQSYDHLPGAAGAAPGRAMVPGDTAGKAKELVRLLHEEAKVI